MQFSTISFKFLLSAYLFSGFLLDTVGYTVGEELNKR